MTFYRHNVITSFQKQEHGFLCFKLQYYYNILTIRDAWFSIALKRSCYSCCYNIMTKEGAPFSIFFIVQTHTMLQLCLHHENRKSMVLYSSNRDHAPTVVMKL